MSGLTAETPTAQDPRAFTVPQQTPLSSPFRGTLPQQPPLKEHHASIVIRECTGLIMCRCHAAGMDINDCAASQGPATVSDVDVSPTTHAQESGLQPASSNGSPPRAPPNLPPVALDVRLPPLHTKQAAQLYLLAIGHGSLFAGNPCSVTTPAPVAARTPEQHPYNLYNTGKANVSPFMRCMTAPPASSLLRVDRM
jgi:hypothetical protein